MKDILNQLFEQKKLSKNQAREVLTDIAQLKYNNSQVAAFLAVFSMRGVAPQELEGFREAMLNLCVPVDLSEYDPIDLCGTGGDGKDTFNISTLASFIVAGAGVKVAKHGNKAVSSACGSSNVLEYFGYQFTSDIGKLRKSLEETGLCFLHAPLFHPAMKNIAPIRAELGFKTLFNMLGPMINPAFVKKQMVGVFSLELARLYHYLYQKTDKNYVIVHALDGYDEISLTGFTKLYSNKGEQIIEPSDLGRKLLKPEELRGGSTVNESADIFKAILENRGTDAQNEAVIANAGLAIWCAKDGSSILDTQKEAEESLKSGRALEVFKKLISK